MTGATNAELGESSIGKLLFRLSVPTIIAQMVNLLYNMVDRAYIGHIEGIGSMALTGLGLCFPIIVLITAFANLIGQGGAPHAAIYMGRKDNETAEKILGNCFLFIIILSVVVSIVLEIFAEPLLILFGASENTLPHALAYLRIYIFGSIFVMLTLGLNPFITTQGATKTSMKTVLIGAVCNIILDPIFIFAFDLKVQGAAIATIISQAISAVWVLYFLTHKNSVLRIKKRNLKPDVKIAKRVLSLGISPFIMNSTESVLNIMFNSSLSRFGGDIAVGAMTILSSVMQFSFMPVQGLTQGAQPIMSYNYGAGNKTRVMKTFKLLLISSVSFTFALWLFVELSPGTFVRIFNSKDKELYDMTCWALRIYMASTCIFGVQLACQQTFLALGQAKISIFIACLRKIILLIPLIIILPHFVPNKVLGVFLAEPIADGISAITAGILFFINIKKYWI